MTNQAAVAKDKKNQKPGIRLTGNQKSWLISAHVISGAIWFGTGLAMVIMVINSLDRTNGDELYAINSVIKLLDDRKIGFQASPL